MRRITVGFIQSIRIDGRHRYHTSPVEIQSGLILGHEHSRKNAFQVLNMMVLKKDRKKVRWRDKVYIIYQNDITSQIDISILIFLLACYKSLHNGGYRTAS